MFKYRVFLLIFKQKLATTFEYRTNFVVQILAKFVSFLFLIAVWKGLRPDDFQTTIWMFYVLVAVVGSFNGASFYRQMSADINNGQLSFYLLQPYSYLARITAQLLTDALVDMFIAVGAISLIGLFTQGIIQLTFLNLFLAFPFLLLGRLIGILISFLAGCISFLWLNPDSFYLVLDVILAFLFGATIPFWYLPQFWQNLFLLLPFRSVIATPVEIAIGIKGNLELILISAFAWLIILGIASLKIWKKVLFYYEAVGS